MQAELEGAIGEMSTRFNNAFEKQAADTKKLKKLTTFVGFDLDGRLTYAPNTVNLAKRETGQRF